MFSKGQSYLKSANYEIDSFIEEGDIYNSKFLYILRHLPSQGDYLVVLNKYRIDLISKDIYGSDSYGEILLLYNGISINELSPGTIIQSPKIGVLNNLASKINVISNLKEYINKINSI